MSVQEAAENLASRLRDYRAREIQQITQNDVIGWVEQFPQDSRFDIVDELNHVFSVLYLSKDDCLRTLSKVAHSSKLAGLNPLTAESNLRGGST